MDDQLLAVGRQLGAELGPVLAAMRLAVHEVRDDADVANLPELPMRRRLQAFGDGRHAVRLLNGKSDDFRIGAVGAEQRDVGAVQRGDHLGHRSAVGRGQNLAGEIRRGRMRHGVVRMDDIELLGARHLDDLVGQRQQVLRFAEHRVRRRLDAMKRQAGLVVAEPERRVRCSARARGVRGRPASCPVRWRRCRCLQSRRSRRCRCSRCFQQRWTQDWVAHDEALSPRDAGKGAELCVPALDELPEQWCIQPRRGGCPRPADETATRGSRGPGVSVRSALRRRSRTRDDRRR